MRPFTSFRVTGMRRPFTSFRVTGRRMQGDEEEDAG
jgi:hypothetical protein